MIAGYAGMFTLLHITKIYLPRFLTISVAILLAISLLCFVVGEVIKMALYTITGAKLSKIIEDNRFDPPQRIAAAKEFETKMRLIDNRLWPWHFWPALGLGVLGGLLLIGTFVYSLSLGTSHI